MSNTMLVGFTGHMHDVDEGLINMRGRLYDPEIGKFVTADPLELIGDGLSLNRYAYVRNDPLNLVDPSGFLVDGGSAVAAGAVVVAAGALIYGCVDGGGCKNAWEEIKDWDIWDPSEWFGGGDDEPAAPTAPRGQGGGAHGAGGDGDGAGGQGGSNEPGGAPTESAPTAVAPSPAEVASGGTGGGAGGARGAGGNLQSMPLYFPKLTVFGGMSGRVVLTPLLGQADLGLALELSPLELDVVDLDVYAHIGLGPSTGGIGLVGNSYGRGAEGGFFLGSIDELQSSVAFNIDTPLGGVSLLGIPNRGGIPVRGLSFGGSSAGYSLSVTAFSDLAQ